MNLLKKKFKEVRTLEREDMLELKRIDTTIMLLVSMLVVVCLALVLILINYVIIVLLALYREGHLLDDAFFYGYYTFLSGGSLLGHHVINWCFKQAKGVSLKCRHHVAITCSWVLGLSSFMIMWFLQFMEISTMYHDQWHVFFLIFIIMLLACGNAWFTVRQYHPKEKKSGEENAIESATDALIVQIDAHIAQRWREMSEMMDEVMRTHEVRMNGREDERMKVSKSEKVIESCVINDYLELKLMSGETNIYVKGSKFMQCKYLLFNIALDEVEDYDEISSIDEAIERLDRSNESDKFRLTPEEEFWGHCSNLQAWYEHGYDARLLHSNLAFPLLKALVDAGDPQAKTALKEAIATRIEAKEFNRILMLALEGMLGYLSNDEIDALTLTDLEKDFMKYLKEKEKNVK